MIYKTIFLSALLVPAITYGDIDTDILQLKEIIFQKELALSKIANEIEKQEELIESMISKTIETAAKVYRSLGSEEEKKELCKKLDEIEKKCEKILEVRNVKKFLMDELFNDMTDQADRIERIKSLLIRRVIEKEILKKMIRDYAQPFEELVNMHLELVELEKILAAKA
ncbi:MAG TPA: hypothetical protein VHO47_02085 [Candidatus Babeliales bacterium]|nr:hypothetical protein [Candidatus Babeliales bacterium]